MNATNCKHRTYPSGAMIHGLQCSKTAVKDDYCRIHHPDYKSPRRAALRKAADERFAILQRSRKVEEAKRAVLSAAKAYAEAGTGVDAFATRHALLESVDALTALEANQEDA